MKITRKYFILEGLFSQFQNWRIIILIFSNILWEWNIYWFIDQPEKIDCFFMDCRQENTFWGYHKIFVYTNWKCENLFDTINIKNPFQPCHAIIRTNVEKLHCNSIHSAMQILTWKFQQKINFNYIHKIYKGNHKI